MADANALLFGKDSAQNFWAKPPDQQKGELIKLNPKIKADDPRWDTFLTAARQKAQSQGVFGSAQPPATRAAAPAQSTPVAHPVSQPAPAKPSSAGQAAQSSPPPKPQVAPGRGGSQPQTSTAPPPDTRWIHSLQRGRGEAMVPIDQFMANSLGLLNKVTPKGSSFESALSAGEKMYRNEAQTRLRELADDAEKNGMPRTTAEKVIEGTLAAAGRLAPYAATRGKWGSGVVGAIEHADEGPGAMVSGGIKGVLETAALGRLAHGGEKVINKIPFAWKIPEVAKKAIVPAVIGAASGAPGGIGDAAGSALTMGALGVIGSRGEQPPGIRESIAKARAKAGEVVRTAGDVTAPVVERATDVAATGTQRVRLALLRDKIANPSTPQAARTAAQAEVDHIERSQVGTLRAARMAGQTGLDLRTPPPPKTAAEIKAAPPAELEAQGALDFSQPRPAAKPPAPPPTREAEAAVAPMREQLEAQLQDPKLSPERRTELQAKLDALGKKPASTAPAAPVTETPPVVAAAPVVEPPPAPAPAPAPEPVAAPAPGATPIPERPATVAPTPVPEAPVPAAEPAAAAPEPPHPATLYSLQSVMNDIRSRGMSEVMVSDSYNGDDITIKADASPEEIEDAARKLGNASRLHYTATGTDKNGNEITTYSKSQIKIVVDPPKPAAPVKGLPKPGTSIKSGENVWVSGYAPGTEFTFAGPSKTVPGKFEVIPSTNKSAPIHMSREDIETHFGATAREQALEEADELRARAEEEAEKARAKGDAQAAAEAEKLALKAAAKKKKAKAAITPEQKDAEADRKEKAARDRKMSKKLEEARAEHARLIAESAIKH